MAKHAEESLIVLERFKKQVVNARKREVEVHEAASKAGEELSASGGGLPFE